MNSSRKPRTEQDALIQARVEAAVAKHKRDKEVLQEEAEVRASSSLVVVVGGMWTQNGLDQ